MHISSKPRVCLVTDEVMPFTRGGIGAFIRNMIKSYDGSVDFTILMTNSILVDLEEWNRIYPNVKLLFMANIITADDKSFKLEKTNTRHAFQQKSMLIYQALHELSDRGCQFDFIEFIDWGGPAFYSTQAKLLGIWTTDAILAVRIHCTESVLRHVEFRYPNEGHNIIYDLERKSLADADLVVASLAPVADFYESFYGFTTDWRAAVSIERPVVLVDKQRDWTTIPRKNTDIVFSSKLQEVKRPRTFLDGALNFVIRNRRFEGQIIFAAFVADETERDNLIAMLPNNHKERVFFDSIIDNTERNIIISKSIVVFPNAFEAFCFAAYEASLSGAIVVLNSSNPAFGSTSPWVDEENCLKFDGTAADLSKVLEKAVYGQNKILRPIDISLNDEPYWLSRKIFVEKSSSLNLESIDVAVTILLLHRDQPSELELTIRNLSREIIPLNIVILDNNSLSPDANLVLSKIEFTDSKNISVIRSNFRRSWGSMINEVRCLVSQPFTCIMPVGSTFTNGFLGAMVAALLKQNKFDVILPNSATVDREGSADPSYVFQSLGESLATGGFINSYTAHVFVIRSRFLRNYNFSEQMDNNFGWDFLRKLSISGSRMLVWFQIDMFYSSRSIGLFETYRPRDLAFNRDLVIKSSFGHRTYGVLSDINSSNIDMSISQTTNSMPQSTLLPVEKLTVPERDELELRRNYRNKPKNSKSKLKQTMIRILPKSNRLYYHIDRYENATEQNANYIVQRGQALVVSGWGFLLFGNMPLLAHIEIVGREPNPKNITMQRYHRLDVALKFDLPEELEVGFDATIPTQDLLLAEYTFRIIFAHNGKTIRLIEKSLIIV